MAASARKITHLQGTPLISAQDILRMSSPVQPPREASIANRLLTVVAANLCTLLEDVRDALPAGWERDEFTSIIADARTVLSEVGAK